MLGGENSWQSRPDVKILILDWAPRSTQCSVAKTPRVAAVEESFLPAAVTEMDTTAMFGRPIRILGVFNEWHAENSAMPRGAASASGTEFSGVISGTNPGGSDRSGREPAQAMQRCTGQGCPDHGRTESS